MRPEFLRAVLDTLLPAEWGANPESRDLPSASAAGVNLAGYTVTARPVLNAIARAAGGGARFVRATEEARVEMLKVVDRQMPQAFRALTMQLLADYYESPQVLSAFGWRTDPPQPLGHPLPRIDAATEQRLDRVRRRGKTWRG